uniref:RNase H type-1 domain-containing protein n=1 Tax=Cannabis sativa TaxID=3483 RepID=A0A803Q2E5_CANSA
MLPFIRKPIVSSTSRLRMGMWSILRMGPGLEEQDIGILAQDFTADESTFVLGRVTYDNIIIANELVHAITNRRVGLFTILRNYQGRGLLRGIVISRNTPPITHLLFVDDNILFCSADQSYCDALNHALAIYSKVPGQGINFAKSSILFSPNTSTDIKDLFFHTFQLENRPFITKYLGLSQCLSRSKYPAFTFLKDKISSIIHSWRHKWFSKVGKETLIKVVLQAIPSYDIACFRIPTNIYAAIDVVSKKHNFGVVARDDYDNIKVGLVVPVEGVVPPEVAEAKAILAAISWIHAAKLPISILASDCKSVVDKINNFYCSNSVLSDIINCINNSLFSPDLLIIHVPRENNKLAHSHARVGLKLNSGCVWNGSLPSILT